MPIFLRQKSTNLKCKYKKAARKTFVQKAVRKMLVKLRPGGNFRSQMLDRAWHSKSLNNEK
jgi:hypothetical protein